MSLCSINPVDTEDRFRNYVTCSVTWVWESVAVCTYFEYYLHPSFWAHFVSVFLTPAVLHFDETLFGGRGRVRVDVLRIC